MSTDIREIQNKLWAMATELRATMDASEYKNYILAFMFYRYLSEHQENYLVENNIIDVAEGQTVNDAYKAEASGEDLADYLEDISSSLGYAIEPDDTWASLVERINDSEVIPSDYQRLFDNFNKNTLLNSDATIDFNGVFNDVNLGDTRLGANTNERAKALNNIVNLINSVSYKDDDGQDILGAIYEYLISMFAASAGKKGGEFYTPHEVSKILARIVTLPVKEPLDRAFSVYDPTCGSGSLLLTVKDALIGGDRPGSIKFYGQERNTTTYNLARMNLMMHGVAFNNMTLNNADTLERDWPDGLNAEGIDCPRMFDAVVANPPYSQKWDNNESKLKDARFSSYGKLAPKTKADYAFVLHGLYHLDSNGTMAIVLPHGVLFRGAAEEVIRKAILDNNYLDAVIGLPANLFYGVSIPTIIMVFKKNRQNSDVLFIDASNEFEKGKNQNRLTDENIEKILKTYEERKDVEKYAHLATMDEIRANDYNLNIPRYVDTFEEEAEIDLQQVLKDLKADQDEIEELELEINEQLRLLGVEI